MVMSKEAVVFATVQIPQDLSKKIKILAAVQGVAIKELVAKVLDKHVNDELSKMLPGFGEKASCPVAAE